MGALVLDIKVAILDYDQVHVLENADGHEDEGVAHGRADYLVFADSVSEREQDGVTIHHTEE